MFTSFDAGLRAVPGRWETSEAFLASIQDLVEVSAAAFGVVSSEAPTVDEIIAYAGLDIDYVGKWCDAQRSGGSSFQAAVRSGLPVTQTTANGREWHHMLIARPTAPVSDRCWMLMLRRADQRFYARDEQLAALLLHQMSVEIDAPREQEKGTLLVGKDYRLIHSDPYSRAHFLRFPGYFDEFISLFRRVVDQRWPELDDDAWHDFAASVAGRRLWICFRLRRLGETHRQWQIETRPLDEDLPAAGVLDDDRVARALAYIHDAHGSAPSLNDVADAVGVSPFHFHRLFSQAVGVSPKQYLQRKQLQMARWMLRAADAPIGTIARRAGFSSHGHFTATFQRLAGMSPTAYREQQLNGSIEEEEIDAAAS